MMPTAGRSCDAPRQICPPAAGLSSIKPTVRARIGGCESCGDAGGACADNGDVESEMFDAIHWLLFPYLLRRALGNCDAAALR